MPKPKTESKVKELRFPGGSIRYHPDADPFTARMAKAMAKGIKAGKQEDGQTRSSLRLGKPWNNGGLLVRTLTWAEVTATAKCTNFLCAGCRRRQKPAD